jgi:uncharacterized protein
MEQTKLVSIVLDVLKPHEPPLTELALYIGELLGSRRVEITLIERDVNTESLEVVINGNIDYENLRSRLAVKGAVIHSVDHVVVVSSS